ncbi:hypothetical protein FB451DRAFT_1341767 [Mycena latifolia]|nr:hypothetical protein FB451DRAFT_1341767 [Mycena latifolia]
MKIYNYYPCANIQFYSTWLLPFFAMVSQLPFGGDTIFENSMSILLNVGSPTLAAYSVTLTVLNSRWIYRLFSGISYPSAKNAARVLNNLQQFPFEVSWDGYVLASLVVLPENDEWWSELLDYLDIKHAYTWSFANGASIIWVVVAFSLTLIDAFTSKLCSIVISMPANHRPISRALIQLSIGDGVAVGLTWLWLLAIVICCLNAGPRCDTKILRNAIHHANRKAYIATHTGQAVPLDSTSNPPAISLEGPLRKDEERSSPIYNYARLGPWSLSVQRIYVAFSAASVRAAHGVPVASDSPWDTSGADAVAPSNRRGSAEELLGGDPPHDISGLRWRSLYASCMALCLTWGTIGSAILLDWATPTVGLSCRSGGYLIYALNSTIVWAVLLSSSLYPRVSLTEKTRRRCSLSPTLAIITRRAAKTLACINAIWIVLTCTFQLAGVYSTCWCNSSRLYLGSRAYNVMILTEPDMHNFLTPVVASTTLAWFVAVRSPFYDLTFSHAARLSVARTSLLTHRRAEAL